MSKIREAVSESSNILEKFSEKGAVNGNFGTDSLLRLYNEAKDLEDSAKSFRKKVVKGEVKRRAIEEGDRTSDGRPVIEGDNLEAECYNTSYSTNDNEEILSHLRELAEDDLDKAFSVLGDLLKSRGFSKTSVREAIQQGNLPESAHEKHEPDHEDDPSRVTIREVE